MALSLNRAARGVRVLKSAFGFKVLRHYADSPSSTLTLTFGTPLKAYFNQESVSQVDLPSLSGSFGILPNHVPVIAVLKPGLVTVYKESAQHKFIVSSGTVTVNADSSAQILAEEAAPLENFDLHTAKQSLDQANTLLSGVSNEQDRASAMVQIEAYEAIVKALERS